MDKAHTLKDSFTDNTPDLTKWNLFGNSPPERIREVNQRVEIRPPSNTASGYAGYISVATYDLTNSYVAVQVVQALISDVQAQTIVQAQIDANNKVYLAIQGGAVFAWEVVAGTYTARAAAAYEPAVHQWLRLREFSGITYWETSADGAEWTTLFQEPDPIALTAVRLTFSAGTGAGLPAPGVAIFDNFNTQARSPVRRVEERRLSARDVRVQAADVDAARYHAPHENNNDEVNYELGLIGSYAKSLRHNSTTGEPDPTSYASLLRALESRAPDDFDEILLASSSSIKLTNPQTGLTFDTEGPDAQTFTLPPAPRLDSVQAAHEAGELYWMAVARDVPFISYSGDPLIAAAVSSLNAEFPQFGGNGPVSAQNVFRGTFPGDTAGPFVSQFLLKGNTDKRKPAGGGKDAADGFISYGAQVINQRQYSVLQGTTSDFLTSFGDWLNAQNGADTRGADKFDTTLRFIRTLRDGSNFVHFDQVLNAFYNAAWILLTEPPGDQQFGASNTGRPLVDTEFPYNEGNPYNPPGSDRDSRTQSGFATFGPPHVLQLLPEVLGRALRAVWWQKWGVHRRLRPEEYGGRVQVKITSGRAYPLDPSITSSLTGGQLAPYYGAAAKRYPSYLLPQAYPEGAPTHPSYGAGHAAGSGAMATILKAFFDDTAVIENPLQADATGTSLVPYGLPLATPLTVGGELNKLASNISLFRNAAGVHWRTDHVESLLLGEKVAIALLQEQSLGFNEDDAYFAFTRFDGTRIRIFDGVVQINY